LRDALRVTNTHTCRYISQSEYKCFPSSLRSHPRRVLETLRHGEQPVNGIVSELAIRQSGVSRHLRILFNAGLVTIRAEGQRRLYSLRPEPFRQIETWLSGYRQI
jgi:DNA-binding transcriptional ArsR family regulator